jgi:transposase
LPRKRVEHDIPEEQKICACCQGALHRIGEDVSEQLHIPPATPWVWQHVRFKTAAAIANGMGSARR